MHVYGGVSTAAAKIVASISGGSSSPQELDVECDGGTASWDVRIEVKGAPNTILTVKHQQSSDSRGYVTLEAAAVQYFTTDTYEGDFDGSSSSSSSSSNSSSAGHRHRIGSLRRAASSSVGIDSQPADEAREDEAEYYEMQENEEDETMEESQDPINQPWGVVFQGAVITTL